MVQVRGLKPPLSLQKQVCSEVLDESRGEARAGAVDAQRDGRAFAAVGSP